jgi:hypothetical protein
VSDIAQEGIQALLDRDDALESWLRADVVRSYDAYEVDPTRGIPGEQVMARIRARYAEDGKPPRAK